MYELQYALEVGVQLDVKELNNGEIQVAWANGQCVEIISKKEAIELGLMKEADTTTTIKTIIADILSNYTDVYEKSNVRADLEKMALRVSKYIDLNEPLEITELTYLDQYGRVSPNINGYIKTKAGKEISIKSHKAQTKNVMFYRYIVKEITE